jgi:Kef-type K+ transport system membrane component KefB
VAALAALYALARHAAGSAVVGLLASVATLSSWALLRYKVLLKPVIPTTTLPGLDRSTVAVALGVAVAAAYLAITGGGLRLPELDDD